MVSNDALTIVLVLMGVVALIFVACAIGIWLGDKLDIPDIKLPRLFFTMLANAILVGLIYFIAPQQVAVTLYKILLITLAANVAYWVDRAVFPYARPHEFEANDAFIFTLSMLRRAIIIGSAMLAVSLGA